MMLTFFDGEDEVKAELVIHVVNVNDPPVITFLLPENGTKVKKGKTLVLSVTAEDEDGDALSVTWKEGDLVLGTSPSLEVKLKPGEHKITVVVDDGTGVTEDSFVIIVKEEEESPGSGLVAAIAALGLAGLAPWRRLARVDSR